MKCKICLLEKNTIGLSLDDYKTMEEVIAHITQDHKMFTGYAVLNYYFDLMAEE